MSKILLPAKVAQWPAFNQNQEGLQRITPNLFEGRLYTFDNVKSLGVPSLFAHPFVFSKRLERDNIGNSDEFRQFSTIIKSIFLGVLEIKKIPIANLGVLGQVASGFEAGMNSFEILTWRKKTNGQWDEYIIGGLYPECLAFPGVRVTQRVLDDIELENMEREQSFGADAVRGHFKQWVDQVTAPLPGGNLPLWAKKLLHMTNANGVWDSSNLNLAVLPALANRSLQLETVIVSNGNAVIQIPLVRYIDHLLVCQNNGAAVTINLSEHEVSLELGSGKNIICTRLDNRTRVCGHDCQINGIGPTIEEEGFFERRPGEYIIWKDFAEASLPMGCTDVEYFDDHALFTFGNLKLKIKGNVLTKEDIFCESVIRFDNRRMPELPIKSEYLDCIEEVSRQDGHTTYDIRLRGVGQRITYAPKLIDVDKASILLWPSFKDPAWKVNYAFFEPSVTLVGRDPFIKLINFADGNVERLATDIRASNGKKVGLPITHVEICLTDNGHTKPSGLFTDNRQNASQVAGGAIDLALDFGTSNTVLAIKDVLGGGNIAYRELDITDKTFDMLDYYHNKVAIHERAKWLPSYAPSAVGSGLSSNPSELIFVDKKKRDPEYLPNAMLDYTVPHLAYNRSSAYEEVVLNFKWDAPAPFNGREDETKIAYLKIIMHMALATLRDAPYVRNNIVFTATYPLSFGFDKYNSYKNLLNGIIRQVQAETGMQITLRQVNAAGQVELLPESHAGKARFDSGGHQIVVDIGGHTTDIALSHGTDILAVDSINYAGGIYIDYLTKNFPDSLMPYDKNPDTLNRDEKRIIINREIRKEGFNAGIVSKYNDDNRKKEAISKLEEFFKKGLFEYICLLLEAHNIRNEVTLYPIGNAWEFINAIGNTGGVERFVANWFNKKGIKLNVVSPMRYAGKGGSSTRKGSVATGALRLADDRGFVHPDLYCPVMSVVGCDIELSCDNGTRYIAKNERVPFNIAGTTSQPLISTERFVNSLNWAAKIQNTVEIIQRFNAESKKALHRKDGAWQLTSSLFAIFLEKIVPEYYL